MKRIWQMKTVKKDDTGSLASETTSENDNVRPNGVNEKAPEPEPINESETTSGSTEGIDVDLTVPLLTVSGRRARTDTKSEKRPNRVGIC